MGLTKAQKEAKKLAKLAAEAEERKQVKRDELRREVQAQERTRDELDRSWRALMLKIKEPVFRKDIEIMWRTFERAIDKKNHQITYTMKLMDVADDQFQRTVASFCDTIDTMINKFQAELEDMSKENNRMTADLLKRGEDAAACIMKEHGNAETHLQLLLYHADRVADTQVWASRGEYLVKEDEERTKYFNDRENLRSFLENAYNNMWEDYKAVLKAYVTGTADNQKQVRKLRRKENMMADVIASQGKKIANSGGLLKRLRTELAAYESGTKQAVFRDRRDRHRAACQRLKMTMFDGVDLDTAQLSTLVKASDSAVDWLSDALKKGEKILSTAALCRKFATQREKVLPYGTETPHSTTQNTANLRRQQSDDSLVANAVSTTCGLTRMWQLVAKAEMTKRALLREKQLLQRENKLLQEKILELRDLQMGPSAKTCLCKKTSSQKVLPKPVAIEARFEVSKFV
ncbi:hypothetical protein MSG28_006072 [Choristoneura fumiferana]|uniref:Uncharacterized protein n=1 Tax=Choristoneura fumiferana TaxID=7141 RepID=A0ACC0JDL3_CHOFU|nr:hypothetical protein MSG28_006072 [Choristoneura fumiferana]